MAEMSFSPPNTKQVVVTCSSGQCEVDAGTTVREVLKKMEPDAFPGYLGAILNHRLVDLDEPIWGKCRCRGIELSDHWMGASIYRRSATLILYEAALALFPKLSLEIGQSLGNGYHVSLQGEVPEAVDWLIQLERQCHQIISENRAFHRRVVNIDEAIELFREQGSEDKVQLLRVWNTDLVHLVTLGRYYEIQHGPVARMTSQIDPFHLEPFPPGFVFEFEDVIRIGIGKHPTSQQVLFRTYQESRRWNRILGVTTVGQLNELALDGKMQDIIRITEGFHEKKIAQIADQIADRGQVQLITIAGPSSAGKTTFANRLATQLRVNGLQPKALSIDDYYLNRDDMPRLPNGELDLESVEALDLGLFNQHLHRLLAGETVSLPHFDFTTGKRTHPSTWTQTKLAPGHILIIEGIHGLNPRLSEAVPLERKFRVFINALTQLNLDRSNRLFTSETRLLRRLVRDRRYRGYNAGHTIAKWAGVREGERKYIFPYQEGVDAMFNSALIYELSVLKLFAERYLLEVPRDHPSAPFAHRLRNFLQLFVVIEPHDIPPTSILREFVGDGLKY